MLIKLKWNKVALDLEIDVSQGVSSLKSKIYELTGVPVDRQKLMAKGAWTGILKDDVDLSTTKLTEGHQVTLMGTAEVVIAPKTEVLFVEDMTDAQKAEKGAVLPAGIVNLGNTCYMNSLLQCIRGMPELRRALDGLPGDGLRGNPNLALSSCLRDTLIQLDRSVESFTPVQFVLMLRSLFPIFAQQTPQGGYMQQDAEEFYNVVTGALSGSLESTDKPLDHFLRMELESVLTCQECPDEPSTRTTELSTKLICNIQGGQGSAVSINHLHEGLSLGLEGTIEKHSRILSRNAIWSKRQRISRLPKFLCVQYMRFFWKATPDNADRAGTKCKIMRAINFTETFDIYSFCSDRLQERLRSNRAQADNVFNASLTSSSAVVESSPLPPPPPSNAGMEVDALDEEEAALQAALALSMSGDGSAGVSGATAVSFKAAAVAESEVASAPSSDTSVFGPGIPANFTGNYELIGVVTHKGRDADSGHYIGWVRSGPGSSSWWRFDDQVVTEVTTAEILALKGGGDWHTAYLSFYRAKE